MKKTQIKKLRTIRLAVEKEKKRLRIAEPKFTIQLDSKTDKLLLGYSISVDVGINEKGNRIIRRKQKKKYLQNATINDLEYVVMNVQNYADMVMTELNKTNKSISTDEDNLIYWRDRYIQANRVGTLIVNETSLKNDSQSLKYLFEWLESNEPKMMGIWNWVDEGKDCLIRYMKYKKKYGGSWKVWSDGTVNSNYRRIRAFFNFIGENVDAYPKRLLNNMPFKKPKITTETFTSVEIQMVKQFIDEKSGTEEWFWFTPILHTLLETGCRVSEVVKLKIRNLDIEERKISVVGKGDKKRFLYMKSDSLWNRLKPYIFSGDNKIRTDKEYIFHYKHYIGNNNGKYYLKEDLNRGFTTSGVQHKFKKMVKELRINQRLSTHCCRRYFITEMLKKTNGDIPLVAQLVGHNSWDVVKLYTKDLVDDTKKVNVGLFD